MKTIPLNIYLLSIVLIFSQFNLYGQKKEETRSKPLGDTITKKLIQQFTYKEFRKIYFPNVQNGFGNYASIDLSKTAVDFSGNIVSRKGDVFGLKINGGVSDGISSIFNNNKWNTEFSMNASFNLMQPFLKKDNKKFVFYKRFEYANSTEKEYVRQRRAISSTHQMDLIIADSTLKLRTLQSKLLQFMKDSIKIQEEISLLEKNKLKAGEFITFNLADSVKITNRINLENQKTKLLLKNNQIDSIKTEIAFLLDDSYYYIRKAHLKKDQSAKKILESFPMTGYCIQWFTFGAGFSTNQFKHINLTEPFGNQIKKTGYGSTSLNIQFSEYSKSLKSFKNYYYNISISGTLGDNFSLLNGESIIEKTQLGSTLDTRYKENKYTAYSGDYKTDILSAVFKADLYYFISNTNKIALHIAPRYEVYEELQPTTSLSTGVYFSFTNTLKDKDPLNLEIFYDFNNVAATNAPSLKKQYQRNQVGVRFTFPFNFNK